jgi:hypothetical protein
MKQSAHLPRMWLRRVVMVLPLVLLTPACGNHAATAPTVPTAIPAPTPTPPSPSSIHVTGTVVDDADAPVPGATVTVTPWIGAPATPGHFDPPVSTVTDGVGSYSLAVQSTRDAVGGIGHVRIDKMGYETVSRWDFVVPPGAQVSANLRLSNVIRLAAGQSVLFTVHLDDPDDFDMDGWWVGRRVRIAVPMNGVLTVDVQATPPIQGQTGLQVAGQACCALHASRPASAGTEVEADVLLHGDAKGSQTFVLNTSLTSP